MFIKIKEKEDKLISIIHDDEIRDKICSTYKQQTIQ